MDIKKEIELLENKVRFKLIDEERIRFEEDLNDLKKAFKLFEKINVENIEEAYGPFKIENEFLRDDEYVENNSWNFLKNSKKFKDGYILLEGDGNEK